MKKKRYYVSYYDMIDGWGLFGFYTERLFYNEEDAIICRDKLNKTVSKNCGEHFGIVVKGNSDELGGNNMGVVTTADEKLYKVKDNVREAIRDLSDIVVNECHGHDDFDADYRENLHDVLITLIDLKKKLG